MRPAYSSTAGYHSHGEPFGSGQSGYDQGGDRLTNIRRSIDAIEQRLMNAAAPVAGYGQPSMMAPPMPHPKQNYPAMPQGMHQPMPQPMPQGMPQPMAYGQMNQAPGGPAYAPAPQPMPFAANAAAEIAQRQQMLNANKMMQSSLHRRPKRQCVIWAFQSVLIQVPQLATALLSLSLPPLLLLLLLLLPRKSRCRRGYDIGRHARRFLTHRPSSDIPSRRSGRNTRSRCRPGNRAPTRAPRRRPGTSARECAGAGPG